MQKRDDLLASISAKFIPPLGRLRKATLIRVEMPGMDINSGQEATFEAPTICLYPLILLGGEATLNVPADNSGPGCIFMRPSLESWAKDLLTKKTPAISWGFSLSN